MANHSDGLLARNSPFVSTSEDLGVATWFGGTPNGTGLVVVFRAPSNSVRISRSRRVLGGHGYSANEAEVMVPGRIEPRQVDAVLEVKGQGQRAQAVAIWKRGRNNQAKRSPLATPLPIPARMSVRDEDVIKLDQLRSGRCPRSISSPGTTGSPGSPEGGSHVQTDRQSN